MVKAAAVVVVTEVVADAVTAGVTHFQIHTYTTYSVFLFSFLLTDD